MAKIHLRKWMSQMVSGFKLSIFTNFEICCKRKIDFLYDSTESTLAVKWKEICDRFFLFGVQGSGFLKQVWMKQIRYHNIWMPWKLSTKIVTPWYQDWHVKFQNQN